MLTNNPRIIGIMLMAASVPFVIIGSRDAMISVPRQEADIVVDEVSEAGNDTVTAGENQTTNGNTTEV